MPSIFHLCVRKSKRSVIYPQTSILLQTYNRPARLCYRKKHGLLKCQVLKISQTRKLSYAIEEEDGMEMVWVKAPPGAAESSTPGVIEWEKTIGSKVSAGTIVCRIRFKEGRTLEIKSPVAGTLAVRRKYEGETVSHGDELFKIRLATGERLPKTRKKKKTSQRDYFEEEEEMFGTGKMMTQGTDRSKSSFLSQSESAGSGDRKREVIDVHHEEAGRAYDEAYPRQGTFLTLPDMLPHPFPRIHATTPVSKLMTTINEINMQSTLDFAIKFAKVYEVAYGNKPSLKSIYVKAAAHALNTHPSLNVKLINDERVDKREVDITVGIRHLKVLVFHTLKNPDKMTYIEITRAIKDIEQQVASGTFKSDKGERGFTLSTEWEIGSIVGTPSYSKTCTLGLHNIIKRPVFFDNIIVAHPMMYVSLTYDRKVIDDYDAVEFLKTFRMAMEDPRHILVYNH